MSWTATVEPETASVVGTMDKLTLDDGAHQDAASVDPRAGNEQFADKAREHGWTEQASVPNESDEPDWYGLGARFEWNDEYGDVVPRIPALEARLFGNQHRIQAGQNLANLNKFEVTIEGPKALQPIEEFENAGLHPVVIENLKLCGYTQPTPIQKYCIPVVTGGHDLVATAQTGSGKTAAYLIPVVSRFMGKAKKFAAPRPGVGGENAPRGNTRAEPLAVVVVPTRELAIQIFDEARRLCYRSRLRPAATYGGLPLPQSLDDLGKGCDILIATPGRLVDLMDRPEVLSFKRLRYTIIDEADELLDNSWEDQLRKICSGGDSGVDADHVYMMFSATFPEAAQDLAREYLVQDHFSINVGRPGSSHENIQQDIIWVDSNKKQEALWDYLMSIEPARVLVFCNSKMAVDTLDDLLYNRGLSVTSIHSNRGQREREDSMRAFRSGKCPILVATGVSARGWDIKDIKHVINYDLPSTEYGGIDEYVHRIGRTARIGHHGKATSFYNERNEDIGPSLTNLLIECGCEVPEFLVQYRHEDGLAHFEADDGGQQEVEQDTAVDANDDGGVSAWGATDDNADSDKVVAEELP